MYYWDCSDSDHSYNRRAGDVAFHDFAANMRTLRAWNHSGVIAWRDRVPSGVYSWATQPPFAFPGFT